MQERWCQLPPAASHVVILVRSVIQLRPPSPPSGAQTHDFHDQMRAAVSKLSLCNWEVLSWTLQRVDEIRPAAIALISYQDYHLSVLS